MYIYNIEKYLNEIRGNEKSRLIYFFLFYCHTHVCRQLQYFNTSIYSSVTRHLNTREVLNEITGIRMRVMSVKGFYKENCLRG